MSVRLGTTTAGRDLDRLPAAAVPLLDENFDRRLQTPLTVEGSKKREQGEPETTAGVKTLLAQHPPASGVIGNTIRRRAGINLF